jgi:hypothetical protein
MLLSKLSFIRWRAITDHSKKVIKLVKVLEICRPHPILSIQLMFDYWQRLHRGPNRFHCTGFKSFVTEH